MQTSYSYAQDSGLHGQAHSVRVSRSVSNGVSTVRVWTVTVDSATNDTEYVLEWNYTDSAGRLVEGDVSFTSDASATVAEIADGLADAWNDDAQASGLAVASSDGVADVTITAHSVLQDITVTEDSGDLSIASTGGGDPADLPMGALVIPDDTADGTVGQEATAANMTARVLTFTPPGVAATYTITIEVEGHGTFTATHTDASGTAATIATAMVTAINNAMPADTVLAADTTGDFTLTAEVAGLDFDAEMSGDASGATVTKAETTAGDQLGQIVLGIAARDPGSAGVYDTNGAAAYDGHAQMFVVQEGRVEVDTDESVTLGAPVFYGVAGDDIGAYRTSRGTTTANWLGLPTSKLKFVERISATRAILAVTAG